MSKISKNIKHLRNEKGFTQELLAEKIQITRQAVSSWENDRTQPDVEMLGKLAEVLGVSLEELIYGKKRNTTLELEKQSYNSTITIVFSILGALLVGVGLVLIFVTFWQDMPIIFKGVLSFVPLFAGQASGLFVLWKKKDKAPWCEGGSVLWTAGIAATLTMIYNIFDLSIDWTNVLILIAVSVVPVIVILRTVAPMVVYYGCSIAWAIASYDENESVIALIVAAVFVALGCVYSSRMLKTENKSHRSILAQWISVIAVTVYVCMIGMGMEFLPLFVAGLMAIAICLYLISFKDADMAMPYKIPGLFITAILMFASASIYFDYLEPEKYNIIYIAVCFIAVAITGLLTIKKAKDNFSLGYIAVVIIFYAIYIASLYAMGDSYKSDIEDIFITILKVPAFIAYILMIISGSREKKLMPINLGFVGVAGLMMVIVSQSGLSMLGNGIMLLVFGGVLLAINFKVSKSKQKTPAIENNQEVEYDEK
jgi:transcriptional regulator with XRE-family HTH domain